MKQSRTAAYIEILLGVIFWGASFIATKIALREMSPVSVIWLRSLIGVIILSGAAVFRGRLRLPGVRELGYLSLLGFLGVTLNQGLQASGLVTSLASTTAWIVATIPAFSAILGWLILKEKVSGWQAGGIILAGIGVLLIVSNGKLASLVQGGFGAPGDLLILISAPNWAIFTVLSRRGLKVYPAAWMMLWVMAIGWLFLSIPFAVQGGWNDLAGVSLEGWGAVAFLGVLCSGLAYIFYYDGLQVLPAAQVSVFVYMEPLVAVIVAAVVLGEPILATSLLGGLIILLGVWLVQSRTTTSLQNSTASKAALPVVDRKD